MYIERLGTIGERCLAFFIDSILITLVFIVGMVSVFPYEQIAILFILVPLLYLFKDIFKGRSLGKRLLGLAVRTRNDIESDVTIGKVTLRNLLLVFWPIEFLALVLSTSGQRIGDMLFNTTVVKLNKSKPDHYIRLVESLSGDSDSKQKQKIVKIGGIFIALFIGSLLVTLIVIVSMLKNSGAYEASIMQIEASSEVQDDVGNIEKYGYFPTGTINNKNGYGESTLIIKVKGDKEVIKVKTHSTREPGEEWVIDYFEILP